MAQNLQRAIILHTLGVQVLPVESLWGLAKGGWCTKLKAFSRCKPETTDSRVGAPGCKAESMFGKVFSMCMPVNLGQFRLIGMVPNLRMRENVASSRVCIVLCDDCTHKMRTQGNLAGRPTQEEQPYRNLHPGRRPHGRGRSRRGYRGFVSEALWILD